MGRSPKQISKGKYSNCFFFQDKYKDKDQKRVIKLRLKIKDQTPVDIGVKVNGKKVSVIESHFQNGRVLNGYDYDMLMDINILLAQLSKRAIKVGDDSYKSGIKLNADSLFKLLYSNKSHETSSNLDVEVPVKKLKVETGKEVDISQNDIDQFEAEKLTGYLKGKEFDEEDELLNVNVLRSVGKQVKAIKDKINNMSPEERFVIDPIFNDSPNQLLGMKSHPDTWDDQNIFHCLGYITYGSRIDAMGDKMPLLPEKYKGLYKNLLYYKVNGNPPENIKSFNEDWVHGFYKFLYYQGYEKRHHRTHTNPFGDLSEYKIRPDSVFEKYGINSFGNFNKRMVAYIKALHKAKLIDNDFTGQIDASAFTKKYNGNMSSYGESIYNLSIQEFLTLVKADLEKGSNLDKIRDAFVAAVMLGGLRYKNIKGDKVIQTLDHFQMVRFKQAKTNTLLNNVMIEPVREMMKKYKGKLPPVPSPDAYSMRIRKLAKQLNFNRIIEKPIKKLDGETIKKIPLHDLISSKFARSTYYLLGGAMGLSMEHLAKNAGHNSTDIAMKHYFQLATNYTEDDIVKLLEAFNKK